MRYTINKIFIFLLFVLVFSGCQQETDDYYYGDTPPSVDTDILSLIKEDANYSKFVTILEQYQIDTLFSSGKVYTF